MSLSPVSGAAQAAAAAAAVSNNHNYTAAGPTTPLPAAAADVLAKTPPPPLPPSAGDAPFPSKGNGTPIATAAAPDSATRLRPIDASPRGSAKKLRRAENVSDDMVNALASELGGDNSNDNNHYEQVPTATGGPRSLADVGPKQVLRRRPSGLSLAIFADDEATNTAAAAATPGSARSPWTASSGGTSRQVVSSSSSNALGVRAVSDEEMADSNVGLPLLPPPSEAEMGALPTELQPLVPLAPSSHRRVPSEPSPLSFPECEAGTDLPPLELSGPVNKAAPKDSYGYDVNESTSKESAAGSEAASRNLRQ